MKRAVCALIHRGDKILAVSRKDNPNDFGLVGGKVDDGEDDIEALFRETKEETGLDIIAFTKVFERFDDDFICTTYSCEVTGDIVTKENGVVKEVTWSTLFNGSFGKYNKELYISLLPY